MQEIIDVIKDVVKGDSHSENKSRNIELLLKAYAIQLLKPQVDSGIGFAMEAVGKIASSGYTRNNDLKGSIEELTRIISMVIEKKENN
jgi:hypothetical protein